jgi:hypothetical protein
MIFAGRLDRQPGRLVNARPALRCLVRTQNPRVRRRLIRRISGTDGCGPYLVCLARDECEVDTALMPPRHQCESPEKPRSFSGWTDIAFDAARHF